MLKKNSKSVQALHTDGGGEYHNVNIIEHTETCPDTSQHNPFSERTNQTLVEPRRVLLEQAGLSAKYWEASIEYVAYVKNRLPHSTIGCSPYEKLTGQKPSLKHIRVFGCAAFVYDEHPKSKFHSTGRPRIFLGCNDHGVYTVELLAEKRTVNSVHVTFDESSFLALENMDSSSSSGEDGYQWQVDSESDSDKSSTGSDNDSSDEEDAFPSNFNSSRPTPRSSTSNQTVPDNLK